MSVGKLNNDVLNRVVIDEIKHVREDVLIRPSVGEDCGAIAFGDLACVVTTDPITGADSQIGRLAVNVCINDIASSGAEPVGILLTLLCPEGTENDAIQSILREANETANALGVEIVGGHTEITTAVNKIIVSGTAIGKTPKSQLIRTGGANPEDLIYVTKYAGLEGTAILATDLRKKLVMSLSNRALSEAAALLDQTSVLKEGLIGAKVGVSAMHDATEGGVLGAIYELCEASKKGCRVWYDRFEVLDVTKAICEVFHLDPLRLIASGAMIMTIAPERASKLEKALLEEGIPFHCVGSVTSQPQRVVVYGEEESEAITEPLLPPEADELYKAFE